jgi:hypothetical protein
LYFRSQTGAESGAFRLYENDIQAKGDVRVTFFAHDVEFAAFVNYAGLFLGYVGETLFFEVREMPWRDGDYEFLIGDTPLTLQGPKPEGSAGYLFFSIPEGATDGMLRVRVRDEEIEFGPFMILRHTRPYLKERRIRTVDIKVSNLLGKLLVRDLETVKEWDRVTAQMQYSFEDLDNVTVDGDTLRLTQVKTAGGLFKLDLAITESDNGLISGRITIFSRYDPFKTEQQMSIVFKDLPWRDDYEMYQSIATGPQIEKQLVSLSYTNTSDGTVMEEAHYQGGDVASVFAITIWP